MINLAFEPNEDMGFGNHMGLKRPNGNGSDNVQNPQSSRLSKNDPRSNGKAMSVDHALAKVIAFGEGDWEIRVTKIKGNIVEAGDVQPSLEVGDVIDDQRIQGQSKNERRNGKAMAVEHALANDSAVGEGHLEIGALKIMGHIVEVGDVQPNMEVGEEIEEWRIRGRSKEKKRSKRRKSKTNRRNSRGGDLESENRESQLPQVMAVEPFKRGQGQSHDFLSRGTKVH